MKNLTLGNIAKACNGRLMNMKSELSGREATCVVIDSRKIEEGGIFIATKGERSDGHDFVRSVAEKGALGAIVEKDMSDVDMPYIVVEDSFKALRDIAAFYRNGLDIPIIGITGSVGKTSTKEFVAGTLSAGRRVLKTYMNFNNDVGMPLTLLNIRDEHEIAVVEMGISHFGEMEILASTARPDMCIITNIGQCHLENLIDRDGVLKEKSQMINFMNPDGTVILNFDDDKLITLRDTCTKKVIGFGMSPDFDIYATDIESHGLWGTDATICSGSRKLRVHIPLPGRHMIYNAMAAVAAGYEYGLSNEEIIRGIAGIESTDGRSNIIKTREYTVIDDCYNANPVSMKAAIDLLKTADTRKVAVLGDMFELGERKDEFHAQIGEYAADAGIDVLVAIGELSKKMAEAARNHGGIEVYEFATGDEATESLFKILKTDDSILVKASHGMKLDTIVNLLTNLKEGLKQ